MNVQTDYLTQRPVIESQFTTSDHTSLFIDIGQQKRRPTKRLFYFIEAMNIPPSRPFSR